MKKLLVVSVMGMAGLASFNAKAVDVSADFTASVTLTSVCRVKTGSNAQTLDFGSYTAFGAQVNATAINIDFECTRGYGAAPTVRFDTGTDKTSSAAGATATGAGVVAGLNYTLAVTAGTNTPGTAATTANIGTPDTYRYTVSGSMPAGQAGTGIALAANPVATQARQLIITY